METAAKLTPLMQQYWDVKSTHGDKIVLFRMGDFFEMFHRDAEIAAPILGIALTQRNKKSADETPMCGVPHHSIAGQINKLLAAGMKVAICDQLEDPKQAKGIVKRGVTRVLSPGVVYDPETIDGLSANYLASFDETHVAFLDITTAEAFYYPVSSADSRLRVMRILNPVEIVLTQAQADAWQSSTDLSPLVTVVSDHVADSLAALPMAARRLQIYVREMQGERAAQAPLIFEERELQNRLELGPTVLRHLEVFETYKGEAKGSLFQAVNRCKSSSGARLLRQWLCFPLAQKSAIEKRLDHVQFYLEQNGRLRDIRNELSAMGDIERRLGKIANPSCNPRDLIALADSLFTGVKVSMKAGHKQWSREQVELAEAIATKISTTLVDEPPVQTKNGQMIRVGVTPVLDELILLSTDSQRLILALEARERELTGISSLKVRFNSVFGYYIEITHTHKEKIPKDGRYERKQTLANAERFITKELEEIEHKVLTAQTRRIQVELQIFEDLRADCLKISAILLGLARQWSELDVITSLAWLAVEQNYVRPQLSTEAKLNIEGSRHPVVEQVLPAPFVANDIRLRANECLLLTGPNMAGKSTLMRQVAAASLLAQIGSFVPATRAELPLFDRIFTRIGASDFLSEGLSTFMVEMQETAEMLKQATPHSLVILDEVGRGTSTYDGMSLAHAILEHLLTQTRAMTLFATHYHELTTLQARYPQLHNAHMSIHDDNGVISFMHTLVAGPANKSYGIHVAELAGLPRPVIRKAQEILRGLESGVRAASPQMDLFAGAVVGDTQSRECFEALRALDLNTMTPMQAMAWLSECKQRLHS